MLPSDYTFIGGDNGVHVFPSAYTLKTVGSRTVTATDTGTATINGTSAGITVNPAAAADAGPVRPPRAPSPPATPAR